MQMMVADVDMLAAPCLSVSFGDVYRGLIAQAEGRGLSYLLVQFCENALQTLGFLHAFEAAMYSASHVDRATGR